MTETIREQLEKLFAELNVRIEEINHERRSEGALGVSRTKIRLLGQMSLLVHERVSLILSLAQTGDMDAFLIMEPVIKTEFKALLQKRGLIYDEDSPLVWIPKGTTFEEMFEFGSLIVESIDPESALVSKAVKAPVKNKQLIRQAIASEEFPGLINRILEGGGKLENFT